MRWLLRFVDPDEYPPGTGWWVMRKKLFWTLAGAVALAGIFILAREFVL